MTLAEVAIKRPVLAIVLSIVLVLFGVVGFALLGVREYPAVDPPIVSVRTTYTGANPEVVSSQITEPLEQALSGVAGIRTISSTSSEGSSSIRVEFDLDVDLETAANDIRDKVSGAIRRLPADAEPPVVEKSDADSDAIVFMTVGSDEHDILEVSNVADTLIKERVQTIPGVSTVRIFGEKRYAMRVSLDAGKMAAERVTPGDVQRALAAQNVDLPSGRIEGESVELTVRASGRLTTAEEFNGLTIRSSGGRAIKLSDVGYAELGPENERVGVRDRGRPVIGIAVIPQPNQNAIAIADEFYRRFEEIKKQLPPGYDVEIGYDFTKYVRRSVAEVEETLVVAFALVAFIIFAFLRSLRSTLIPVVAIPVSIIATFFLLWVLDFSINVLTLVGIVLSIGLVCDDAIVVLENIYAKIEAGMRPLEAAIRGSKEIYFAIISTTITLAAVFLPIIFLEGLTGRLFREFAVVVVGSVLISGFVALTLSPMMCRYLLVHSDTPGLLYRVTEPFFRGLTRGYETSLRAFMRVRVIVFPLLAAIVAGAVFAYQAIPSELAPLEDRSNIRISVRAAEGATYDYTHHELEKVAALVDDAVPEVWRSFSIVGGNSSGGAVNAGTQNVYLVDGERRARSQQDIYDALSKETSKLTGVRVAPSQPPTIGSRFGGQPVQYVLQAPTLDALIEVLPEFLQEARKQPELSFVDADLKVNRPAVALRIDRPRADALGVSPLELARTLQLGLGGVRYGYFVMNEKQYEVIGRLQYDDRNEPSDMRRLFVRSDRGEMVGLDSLLQISEEASPAALYRFDRYVSATVSAGTATGATLGDGIDAMDRVAAKVVPASFRTSLAGQARDYADSSSSTTLAFLFALLLVYLVLAAQFESFVDPVIILITVPLSIAGALFSLWLTDATLNVFSQIGIIMLIGLVTKNGILVVEFANQKKEAGAAVREAGVDSAVARFRPILMTSLSTSLGVLPIALSIGGAAGSRRSLGIAVVGGIAFSLLLTLYMVPAVYSFLSRKKRASEAEEAPEQGGAAAIDQAAGAE